MAPFPHYHAKSDSALSIPVPSPSPVQTISPVTLPAPSRNVDLVMRISFPSNLTSDKLPVILLSHGLGHANWISSHYAYTPLSDFYAGRGFVVIQPTHLDFHFLGIKHEGLPWKSRVTDMKQILDEMDKITEQVPQLKGRLDMDKVAVVGHSMGAFTAAQLLGTKNIDPRNQEVFDGSDIRIKAGVLMAAAGNGGDSLSEMAKNIIPFYNPQWDTMIKPTLIVYGDEDNVGLSTRGKAWLRDSYDGSPSPKAILELKGGKHGLGGVATWDAAESDDESPERLGVTQRLSWAYLWSQLYGDDDSAWSTASSALGKLPEVGSIEFK